MGVRGLTTFIKNEEKKYLKNHKLHNCRVLLDGNSIASHLYIWSNVESAFGGDYDKFAKYVKEFFKLLQKCEIKPLVLFDGGYEQRKLKTVYSRLKEKLRSTRETRPFSGSCAFPLLMRLVFREVLSELKVPFAQSDFEADDELAALARSLQCPIISYDSDFYIYDVLYIPFPMLELKPVAFKSPTKEGSANKYYLDCKIYHVEVFVNSFGGLDKSMLPLLAALLGNDYIKRSVFKKFYANLKIPKGKTKPIQRRIKAVIEWLRKETFDSAVEKILERMEKRSRKRVLRQVKKIINGYVKCSSVLREYLTIEEGSVKVKEESNAEVFKNILKNIESTADEMPVEDDQDSVSDEELSRESSNEDSESDDENNLEQVFSSEETSSEYTDFPTWLLDHARKGKVQSCVMDILSLKQHFFPPQVEDYSLPSSHQISTKLLSAIVGFLLGESETLVRCWTRDGTRLDWFTVEPIHESVSVKFPTCEDALKVSESQRRIILLEITKANIDLTLIPENWHLFIIAALYWLSNLKQPVATECYLHTMVMCIVAMNTMDSKIGMHRNKQTFTKKYKSYLSKLESRRNETKALKVSNTENSLQNFEPDKDKIIDLNQALSSVSHDDCVLVFQSILPHHHSSEQIKVKPRLFCLQVVHAFAQFQSCLFHLVVFNSVLGHPLQEPVVHQLFSATFAYNMFNNLSKRANVEAYVETLFQTAPTMLRLYKAIVSLLKSALKEVSLQTNPQKPNRRKRKQVNQSKVEVSAKFQNSEKEEEDFFDENNLFSSLSLNE